MRHANPVVERMLGYAPLELVGVSIRDLLHADELGEDLENLDKMLDGEIDIYSSEKRYVRKDYSQVWVSLTVSLVRDTSGNPSYFISGRKLAELLLRSLTPREVEVLRLHAQGRTNRQIASEVMFSVSTVKNHVQHIIAKLGVSDRTQGAVMAVEFGLIEQDR